MSAARHEGNDKNVDENRSDHSENSSSQIPAPVGNPPPMQRMWPLSLLPIGYRFKPSDGMLVSYYLWRKIDGHPPPPLILEFDVFRTEPWNLPVSEFIGDAEEERYFFCRIKDEVKSADSSAVRKRVVGAAGYWKLTGKEKLILTLPLKAIKSTLLFSRGGGGEDQEEKEEEVEEDEDEEDERATTNAAQTPPKWMMHEFRPQYQNLQGNQIERDQWAAYRVFQKRPRRPQGSVIILRSNLRDLMNRGSIGPNSQSSIELPKSEKNS